MSDFSMNTIHRQAPALCSAMRVLLVVGLVIFAVRNSLATEPTAAIPSPNGLPWLQTFSNDFTSANGANYLSQWAKETGDGTQYGIPGWGNNEKEIYTTNSANLNVTSAGLNITAIVNGSNITSARIKSLGYFSQTGGLFQWTASFPSGGGLWPALWMMPVDSAYGGWPTSGEIDVVESGGSGQQANKVVQGTFHSGTAWNADVSQTGSYSNASFDTRNVNTYDLLWLAPSAGSPQGTLKWYVNGTLYETRNGGWYKPPGGTAGAPFDKPFYMIMNFAIGGNYTGNQTPANGSYTMTVSDVQAFSLPLLGDMNRDGHLDSRDVTAMTSALADPSGWAASKGISALQLNLLGDINQDTTFNSADIQKLISTLKAGGGSESVPEPTGFVLLAAGLAMFGRKTGFQNSRC